MQKPKACGPAKRGRLELLTIAKIYSEQDANDLKEQFDAGHIQPLPPETELSAEMLESCTRIVGMMGHEPIVEAPTTGRQRRTGRTSHRHRGSRSRPITHGNAPRTNLARIKDRRMRRPVHHQPRSGGVFATIDHTGFTIEPLDPNATCTPISVAAHMLYETVNPFQMREPAGTIMVADATYTALDKRRVRVEGSRFELAGQHTIKLEGARTTGYETVSFVGIRDPHIVADIETWARLLRTVLTERVEQTLDLTPNEYAFDIRLYGHNAILEDLDPDHMAAREVGVMLIVNAPDQATATAVAKVANPLLHLPLPNMAYLPSFAFATSPAELERGAAYEFVLNHVVEVDSPTSMFRTVTHV
jgi:hypothetical protein